MAKVCKTGARKPRIVDGTVYHGTNVEWAPPKDGFVRAVGFNYTLAVCTKGEDKAEYVMHLSEDEMLTTVSEWLKSMTLRREQRRRDEAREALKTRAADVRDRSKT